MKIFKCYSGRIANELRHKGFWIIGKEPNMKKPWFDVFLFEDTPELRVAFTDICKSKTL